MPTSATDWFGFMLRVVLSEYTNEVPLFTQDHSLNWVFWYTTLTRIADWRLRSYTPYRLRFTLS